MYRFEKYRVYKSAMALVKAIYEVIKLLPHEEKFGLIDQLRRSSVSIVLNIAEGTGGLGDKEFKSFLRVALKSLYETVAGLKISNEIHNINVSIALEKCDIVGKELNALINSLEKSMKEK
jgi:four helix bundle protein